LRHARQQRVALAASGRKKRLAQDLPARAGGNLEFRPERSRTRPIEHHPAPMPCRIRRQVAGKRHHGEAVTEMPAGLPDDKLVADTT